MKQLLMAAVLSVVWAAFSPVARAAGAEPVADPVLDPPTLHCLAAYWLIGDTDDKPASVTSEYRKAGTEAWLPGPPFIRVLKDSPALHKIKYDSPFFDEGGVQKAPAVAILEGAHMFAGSVFVLQPDTAYEWRLTLNSPDGAKTVRILKDKTIGEPVIPQNAVKRYVVPGAGGGSGSQADPFHGLASADAAAKPGDLFLLHAGTYSGVKLAHNGEAGKPIVWQGAGDGEVIIDGKGRAEADTHVFAVDAEGLHDVWFEKLTACNGNAGFNINEATNIVIQHCNMHDVIRGVYGPVDKGGKVRGLFISDNTMLGIFKWPVTNKEYGDFGNSHGIWMSGKGNVACYNRISHFKDGMDVDESQETVSCDFHNNDVSEVFDDPCEMDGSDRNCRYFYNRSTNSLTGISFQPIHGGPVYAFRNVAYNTRGEPFKMHNAPAGCLIFQNTMVRHGSPCYLSSGVPVYNSWMRNNLLVGSESRAYDGSTKMIDCDFDYDGFAGWSGNTFIKWSNVRYATPEEAQAKCPVEKHAVVLDAAKLFASGLKAPESDLTVFDRETIDMRLAQDSPARGKGEALPWANDGDTGPADLGAYKYGAPIPHYGPRAEGKP